MISTISLLCFLALLTISTVYAADYSLAQLKFTIDSPVTRANPSDNVIKPLKAALFDKYQCFSAWTWTKLDSISQNIMIYGALTSDDGCNIDTITAAFAQIENVSFGSYVDNIEYDQSCYNKDESSMINTANPFQCGPSCNAVYCGLAQTCTNSLDCLPFLKCSKQKVCMIRNMATIAQVSLGVIISMVALTLGLF